MKKLFKKGFTLVELVVVVAIIAILSGVSVAVYAGITDRARQTAAESEADTIGSVLRIAALEDQDGFDFFYDASGNTNKGEYKAWDNQTLETGDFHYTTLVSANGVTFQTVVKNSTLDRYDYTDVEYADANGYKKAADLLTAAFCVHEGLTVDQFIGRYISVDADDIKDGDTIKSFTYVSSASIEVDYEFAK